MMDCTYLSSFWKTKFFFFLSNLLCRLFKKLSIHASKSKIVVRTFQKSLLQKKFIYIQFHLDLIFKTNS